jgi:hypothetical protein
MYDGGLKSIVNRVLYTDTANRTHLHPACVFRTIDECDMHGGKVSPRALQISLCGDVEQSATGALSPFTVDRFGQALTAIGRLGCLSNRQHAGFHDS